MTSALRPLLRIAWRNVRKHWRHSLGAMLSIVVGFIAIGLFEGYLTDLEALQRDWYVHRGMMGHVIVEHRGFSGTEGREDPWAHSLHREEQQFLDEYLRQRADDVETRVRILQLAGLASTGRAGVLFIAWGLDVPESTRLRRDWAWNVTAGKPLDRVGPNSVIVGNGLGSLLDCTGPNPAESLDDLGHPIPRERPLSCRQPLLQLSSTTESGQLNVIDPTIVGLFDAGLKDVDGKFLHLPLEGAQRLADTEAVSMYAILLRDGDGRVPFMEDMRQAAAARGLDLDVMPWEAHPIADLFRRTDSILDIYRNLVILIVVAIAGMSVLTTMLKSVNERVREIGTIRSIGFRRRHVIWLFTFEAAILALVSSGVGLVATWVLTRVINSAHISYDGGMAATPIPLTVSLEPLACAFAITFLSGVAVLAALLPARRAARLGIPDALGHA